MFYDPRMIQKPPYFRLSLFYLVYFAALGSFVPYWSIYLKTLQFNAIEIGQLMGLFMLSKLLAPLLWGWVTDHSGKRLKWIRWAAFLSIVSLAPVFVDHNLYTMAIIMLLFSFFWNASLPQFEALTLNYLGHQVHQYSWIRLWGSIGFIAMVVVLPLLFDDKGIEILPAVVLALFMLIWVTTGLIRDQGSHPHPDTRQGMSSVMKHPMVIALFIACILQTASHGAYYTFFSIYLEDMGHTRRFVGWMWALGVIAEVILFIFMYRLFRHFRAYQLFAVSLLLTAIRWFILAILSDKLALLVFSQLLHATSYGLFHASAIHLIHEWFPGRLQGRGQALYAGLSFGLGGALGSLLSGYLWQFSSAATTFLIMAGIALTGWLVARFMIRRNSLWCV